MSVIHLAAAPPLFDRALEAEEAVLCAMFADSAAISAARLALTGDDFLGGGHQKIFLAICALADRGQTPDPLTVASELSRVGELDACGGKDRIGHLIDAVPTSANVGSHIRLVVESAQQRAMVILLEQSAELAKSGQLLPGALAADLSARLAAVHPISERFHLIDDAAMEKMPPLDFLVDGMIPASGLLAIYGPPASGKSFAALDLAYCVATGDSWFGNRVLRTGPVVYIAAEGAAGLPQRIGAWKAHHGYEGNSLDVHFLREPANLLDDGDRAAIEAVIRRVLPVTPALVIVDTLHRSMPGGDENSARDVGLVIENADHIKRATGAAVLLVHHSRKDSDIERGSSSLRGAVDTLMRVKIDGEARTLSCEKQKDAAEFEPISFQLLSSARSCVVAIGAARDSCGPATITPHQRKALSVLSTHFLADGAPAGQWLKASGLPDASFWRARTELVAQGYALLTGPKKGGRYTLTDSGRGVLTINYQLTVRQLSSRSDDELSANSHPVGVRVADSEDRQSV